MKNDYNKFKQPIHLKSISADQLMRKVNQLAQYTGPKTKPNQNSEIKIHEFIRNSGNLSNPKFKYVFPSIESDSTLIQYDDEVTPNKRQQFKASYLYNKEEDSPNFHPGEHELDGRNYSMDNGRKIKSTVSMARNGRYMNKSCNSLQNPNINKFGYQPKNKKPIIENDYSPLFKDSALKEKENKIIKMVITRKGEKSLSNADEYSNQVNIQSLQKNTPQKSKKQASINLFHSSSFQSLNSIPSQPSIGFSENHEITIQNSKKINKSREQLKKSNPTKNSDKGGADVVVNGTPEKIPNNKDIEVHLGNNDLREEIRKIGHQPKEKHKLSVSAIDIVFLNDDPKKQINSEIYKPKQITRANSRPSTISRDGNRKELISGGGFRKRGNTNSESFIQYKEKSPKIKFNNYKGRNQIIQKDNFEGGSNPNVTQNIINAYSQQNLSNVDSDIFQIKGEQISKAMNLKKFSSFQSIQNRLHWDRQFKLLPEKQNIKNTTNQGIFKLTDGYLQQLEQSYLEYLTKNYLNPDYPIIAIQQDPSIQKISSENTMQYELATKSQNEKENKKLLQSQKSEKNDSYIQVIQHFDEKFLHPKSYGESKKGSIADRLNSTNLSDSNCHQASSKTKNRRNTKSQQGTRDRRRLNQSFNEFLDTPFRESSKKTHKVDRMKNYADERIRALNGSSESKKNKKVVFLKMKNVSYYSCAGSRTQTGIHSRGGSISSKSESVNLENKFGGIKHEKEKVYQTQNQIMTFTENKPKLVPRSKTPSGNVSRQNCKSQNKSAQPRKPSTSQRNTRQDSQAINSSEKESQDKDNFKPPILHANIPIPRPPNDLNQSKELIINCIPTNQSQLSFYENSKPIKMIRSVSTAGGKQGNQVRAIPQAYSKNPTIQSYVTIPRKSIPPKQGKLNSMKVVSFPQNSTSKAPNNKTPKNKRNETPAVGQEAKKFPPLLYHMIPQIRELKKEQKNQLQESNIIDKIFYSHSSINNEKQIQTSKPKPKPLTEISIQKPNTNCSQIESIQESETQSQSKNTIPIQHTAPNRTETLEFIPKSQNGKRQQVLRKRAQPGGLVKTYISYPNEKNMLFNPHESFSGMQITNISKPTLNLKSGILK